MTFGWEICVKHVFWQFLTRNCRKGIWDFPYYLTKLTPLSDPNNMVINFYFIFIIASQHKESKMQFEKVCLNKVFFVVIVIFFVFISLDDNNNDNKMYCATWKIKLDAIISSFACSLKYSVCMQQTFLFHKNVIYANKKIQMVWKWANWKYLSK